MTSGSATWLRGGSIDTYGGDGGGGGGGTGTGRNPSFFCFNGLLRG